LPFPLQEEVAAAARQDMSSYSIQEPSPQPGSSKSSSGGVQPRQIDDPEVRVDQMASAPFAEGFTFILELGACSLQNMQLRKGT